MSSHTLTQAKRSKTDAFYTRLSDIEAALRPFAAQFRGKTVYCNCDDPFESNFFRYFALHFRALGLKRLIATCCACPLGAPDADGEAARQAYRAEVTAVPARWPDGLDGPALAEFLRGVPGNTLCRLAGNGDFRSAECAALLRQADLVVTNPPFSLFREYIALLTEYDKKFLVIGSKNALTYRAIFALLQADRLWLGPPFPQGNAYFRVPPASARAWAPGVYDARTGLVKFRNVGWFTNLDYAARHEKLVLTKRYTPEAYPRYVNYDAIEVSRVADIPLDYDGAMGVPITFLERYDPEQFEIVGSSRWLGRPMSSLAPKGSYASGGVRFYLPLDKPCETGDNFI